MRHRIPTKAISGAQRLAALRILLVMREKWPPDGELLARSYGLPILHVIAEIAAEDIRRRTR